MNFLDVNEVIQLHDLSIERHGGLHGIRDRGALESAIAQPQMTFGGVDLYPSLAEKAAALAFSLIRNHPLVDGNKRTGHAALETLLVRNGYELHANIDEQECVILAVAAGQMSREIFTDGVSQHLVVRKIAEERT